MVPWNIFSIMNQIAAALAALPKSGANVGPRVCARSPPRASEPSVPSQMTGRMPKNSVAMAPDANMARGIFLTGSIVSPTWQAAASKAGAANPTR